MAQQMESQISQLGIVESVGEDLEPEQRRTKTRAEKLCTVSLMVIFFAMLIGWFVSFFLDEDQREFIRPAREGSSRDVYIYGGTVVAVDYNYTTPAVVDNCEIIDVSNDPKRDQILGFISDNYRVKSVNFQEIIDQIIKCESVDAVQGHESVQKGDVADQTSHFAFGYLKKNLWCGIQKHAENYHDLGPNKLDRCCRTHHLCPVKIDNLESRNLSGDYGVPMYHCECDRALYRCLRGSGLIPDHQISAVVFKIIEPACLTMNDTTATLDESSLMVHNHSKDKLFLSR